MGSIRVLLADDHQLVVDDIRELLEPEFEVVSTVSDGEALVREARKLEPDVVVADISMPGMSGIQAGEAIRSSNPGIRIVILTMHDDRALVEQALDAGVLGYVVKVAAGEDLVPAILAALDGERFVSASIGF